MKSRGRPLAIYALTSLIASVVAPICIVPGGPLHAQTASKFGTRSPRVCSEIKTKPTPEQAATLIQCNQETMGPRDITLLENVRVQMGSSQPYNSRTHSHLTGVDTTSQVYLLRGSYTWYHCDPESVIPAIKSDNRGKNCFYVNSSAAEGYCYQTTFGDWNCYLHDDVHNEQVRDQPPPRS